MSDEKYYAQGLLKFKVDDGEVLCMGSDFIDCIVKPSDCSSLSEVRKKFLEYVSRAVYLDLSVNEHYIIDKITYGDLDQYRVLSYYIWNYLKHRIIMYFYFLKSKKMQENGSRQIIGYISNLSSVNIVYKT